MRKSKFYTYSLVLLVIIGITSCSGYQNPGNNSGKTGDGTGTDSLQAKKHDTGKGANLENVEINKQNDSARKRRDNR